MLKMRKENVIEVVGLDRLTDETGKVDVRRTLSLYFGDMKDLLDHQKAKIERLLNLIYCMLGSYKLSPDAASVVLAFIAINFVEDHSVNSSVER